MVVESICNDSNDSIDYDTEEALKIDNDEKEAVKFLTLLTPVWPIALHLGALKQEGQAGWTTML